MLAGTLEESRRLAQAIQENGPWPRLYFTRNGKGGIRRKTYLDSVGGRLPTNFWPYSEVGHTDEAKKELKAIFGGKAPFDTPKPTRLIERVLQIAAGDDAIILDSFAGSGTTADATMRLNESDGGSRRYILIEMMDYADTVTAERARRVISGYGDGKNSVPGIDSGFSYHELGRTLFDSGDVQVQEAFLSTLPPLNSEVPIDAVRRYVWYTETRAPFIDRSGECPWLLGEHAQAAYYLVYSPGSETVLDYDLLADLPVKGSPTVIYASRCALSKERLETMGIVFKQIPSQIARM